MPMKESKATERTFHGLRSRSTNRSDPVMMAVIAGTAVAAIMYPSIAHMALSATAAATAHSKAGLPSWSSETGGCLPFMMNAPCIYIDVPTLCLRVMPCRFRLHTV
jgi:hypothetical protein